MMENLRSAANHVVLKIIFGLIILSFILTGVGGYLGGGADGYAAKVNDQEISRGQFENAVQGERNRLQQQLGDNFSVLAGNEVYMKQLRQQVLSQLIDEVLLDQYTKTLNLGVSDEQIKAAILKQGQFQVDGRFDNSRYQSELARMGVSADYYAQWMRKQMINQQLVGGIGVSGFVLPDEQQSMAALIAQERVIRTATFGVDALKGKQSVTDAELLEYYNQNKNAFVAPEQVKVSFIELDAAKQQDQAPISEDEISAYYELHKSSYTQPERKKFSVILLKTQAEAQSTLDELKNGADFATLARERSVDKFTGRNGGELDWMEPDTTLDEFKQANLTEKGQLSGVINSDGGYAIIRLDDVQEEKVKPLAEVHDAIAATAKQEKALDAYYALQQKVSEGATSDNESLATAEEAAGVKAVQTDWFTSSTVPDVLNFKPLVQAIFEGGLIGENGAPGSNSDVINVEGDRAFVIRVTDYKAEVTKPFDDVREQVAEIVKHQKAEQQARVDAEKLLSALQQGKGEEALQQAGVSFGEPQTVTRTEQQGNPLIGKAFTLQEPQKDKPTFGVSEDLQGNVVLIELQQIKPGKLDDEQMKALTEALEKNQAEITFDSLLASLRQEATIKMGNVVEEGQ